MHPTVDRPSHPNPGSNRRRAAPRPSRRLLLVLALVLVGPALVACGYDGPTEESFLPAVSLAHPHATEVERSFTPEEKIDTIDGANRYYPAKITVDYRFSTPTTKAELEAWYLDRLTADGWSPPELNSDQELRRQRESGGNHHRYAVEHRGDTYRVTYEIRDPACDHDCFAR